MSAAVPLGHRVGRDTQAPVAVLYPHLATRIDGIGDYALRLAHEFGRSRRVVLVGGVSPEFAPASDEAVDLLEGRWDLQVDSKASRLRLVDRLREFGVRWVLVQFSPFAYAHRGISVPLVLLVRDLHRAGLGVLLCEHETTVGFERLQQVPVSVLQRVQLRILQQFSHRLAPSMESIAQNRSHRRRRDACALLPVPSNVPLATASKPQARLALGLAADDMTAVTFGTMSPAHRDVVLLGEAIRRLADSHDPLFLYVGPDASAFEVLCMAAGGRCRAVSMPSLPEVAMYLAAADIGLAPFVGGVSGRRGSFKALLQHGVPAVTTRGPFVGRVLRQAADRGCFELVDVHDFAASCQTLLEDPTRRQGMAERAKLFYQEDCDWPCVIETLDGLMSGPGHDSGVAGGIEVTGVRV